MLHIENTQVSSQPVHTIEGQPNTGIVFVKPLMQGETMALLEVRMRAGVSSSMHAHSHESLLYVVSGRLRTIVNDKTFELGPGDVCRHPRDARHWVEALEDTVFVEVKSPPIDFGRVLGSAAGS
ncbi:MAG: cupin domain-containing protein [Betaproteobacteria bacterium]